MFVEFVCHQGISNFDRGLKRIPATVNLIKYATKVTNNLLQPSTTLPSNGACHLWWDNNKKVDNYGGCDESISEN